MDVIAVFAPLLGAAIAGLLGRQIGDRASQLVSCGLMLVSGLFSLLVFKAVVVDGETWTTELFTWIDSGTFEVSWALRIDTLSAVRPSIRNPTSNRIPSLTIQV